ncbi:MFS general substrate transporter [Marasmius fiardii PR-910]|nr:MFS general substrate transporter [Marasmius fiardii PR-910]
MSEKHSKGSLVDDIETKEIRDEITAPTHIGEPTDPWFAEEKKLVRKLDKRILPLACLLYLFAYLDRSNLGNARLQGLDKDVLGGDPTGVLFDWVTSAFYFTYILVQIPATIMSKLFQPRVWLACSAIGWGLCSTLMSTGFDFGGLMATRVFLGVFEAGFGPAIPVYFSLFYTKSEMGLRMAYWFGFAAVAGAFGGIIAFGVGVANIGISNWRLLFIVEGIPAILLGIATLFLLPNRPETTSYLNEREREIAMARVNRATSAEVGQSVNKAHIGLAFRDWRIYVGGVIYFGLNASLASTSAFLPTLNTTFGFSPAKAQLMTVPPYAVAAVVLTALSAVSDYLQSRGIFMMIATAIGGVGYLILLVVPTNLHARYFATFCITSGTYTGIGIIIAWFAHNLGSETKKATGIPMFMAIGQCGSVLGSHLLPKIEGPRYIKGFAVCCALEFLATLCSFVLTVSYRMDNARRNKKYGVPAAHERVDVSELADKAPAFRYVP